MICGEALWDLFAVESDAGSVSRCASAARLALLLAGSGLYGVVSYSVTQRQQEIGIRMALGAAATDIRRMIVRQTLVLVIMGGVIGLAAGVVLGRVSASVLFRVSPSDPATYGTVIAVPAMVALVAASAPVRRAASVDPLVRCRRPGRSAREQ